MDFLSFIGKMNGLGLEVQFRPNSFNSVLMCVMSYKKDMTWGVQQAFPLHELGHPEAVAFRLMDIEKTVMGRLNKTTP